MSDSSLAEAAVSKTAEVTPWFYRLTFCLPTVFLIGAPSIFITRALYHAYHPEEFIGDSPSISGTASEPPASDFFKWTMLAVTVCVVVSWSLNLMMNQRRLAEGAPNAGLFSGPSLLNFISCLAGLNAGAALAALGIYNLSTGHEVHMMSSWVFYISQVSAFIFDIACVVWLHRLCAHRIGPLERRGLKHRIAIGSGVVVFSLLFLYMYLARENAPATGQYAMQLIYVGSENVVALLCFAYPMSGFLEMRQHYRQLMLRSEIA